MKKILSYIFITLLFTGMLSLCYFAISQNTIVYAQSVGAPAPGIQNRNAVPNSVSTQLSSPANTPANNSNASQLDPSDPFGLNATPAPQGANISTDPNNSGANDSSLSQTDPFGLNDTPAPQGANVLADPPPPTVAQTQANTNDANNGKSTTSAWWDVFSIFNSIIEAIGNFVMSTCAWILGLTGLFFNKTLYFSLIDMKATIDSMGAINEIWKIIRDFVNMFFIFVLLYEAILTIISSNKKQGIEKLLTSLLIAALLMNFSLYFTKVIVDASNVVAFGFYQQLPGIGKTTDLNLGLGGSIMNALKLPTGYQTGNTNTSPLTVAASGSAINYGIATMGMSVFMIITAFVLLAGAILFLIRLLVIILLLISSPMAFAGHILPQFKDYTKKWWEELSNQAMFAPIYMIIMWISFKIITSPAMAAAVGAKPSFSVAFGSLSSATVGIVLNFFIVIYLMIQALVMAKKFGAQGGNFATEWAGKLSFGAAGSLGRNTFGRAASKLASNEKFKDFAAKNKIGKYALMGTRGLSGSSFDFRKTGVAGNLSKAGLGDMGKVRGEGGYAKTLKDQVESRNKFSESLGVNQEDLYEQDIIISKRESDKKAATRLLASPTISPAAKARLQQKIDDYDKQIADAKARKGEIGRERQENYAENINRRSIDTLWIGGVARKNKVAASEILIKTIQKEIDEKEKKITEIKPDLNRLENKERAVTADPRTHLTQAEKDRLVELKGKVTDRENEIREMKLEIGKHKLTT
jgi:hypothetical protein